MEISWAWPIFHLESTDTEMDYHLSHGHLNYMEV